MSSLYPKLPGYSITHDLSSKQDYKKISGSQLDKINNGEIKQKQNFNLPRQDLLNNNVNNNSSSSSSSTFRTGKSLSSSQQDYQNHFTNNENSYTNSNNEQFQPDYVKYDKQVLRFYGYYKEAVVESKKEYARIRKLIICYYLVDGTVSISEEKEMNSGIVQGVYLKRTKIDDINSYNDLQIGKDIYIHGKYIKLYDCDDYTKEFYLNQGILLENKQDIPADNFRSENKFVPKKDNLMKDYLEHRLGGGRVPLQKQFLENDRKVLRFNAKYDTLKYIIHYYLSDDTVEIRELHHNNSGRDPFPLFLKRNKLPRKFSITQPGEIGDFDFYKDSDIEPFMTLWAFNRPFKILGCDEFTEQYYMEKYNKKFPLGGFEDAPQKDKSNVIIPPYNGFGDEVDSLGIHILNYNFRELY